jgi:hypothetical protein
MSSLGGSGRKRSPESQRNRRIRAGSGKASSNDVSTSIPVSLYTFTGLPDFADQNPIPAIPRDHGDFGDLQLLAAFGLRSLRRVHHHESAAAVCIDE